MPLVLSDLVTRESTVTVETTAGPLQVRYRPNAMTPALEADINLAAKSADEDGAAASSALIRTFCTVVSWMDIVGPMHDTAGREVLAAGEPMPVDPRHVTLLPTRLLIDVFTAVQSDLGGGKANRNASSGGSFSRD